MTALLYPHEAALELGMSERTLRKRRQNGDIAYINIGCGNKRICARYDPDDIEAYKQKGRKCQSESAPAKRHIVTASNIEVIDFQAKRAAQTSGKQRNSRKPNGGPSRTN